MKWSDKSTYGDQHIESACYARAQTSDNKNESIGNI